MVIFGCAGESCLFSWTTLAMLQFLVCKTTLPLLLLPSEQKTKEMGWMPPSVGFAKSGAKEPILNSSLSNWVNNGEQTFWAQSPLCHSITVLVYFKKANWEGNGVRSAMSMRGSYAKLSTDLLLISGR